MLDKSRSAQNLPEVREKSYSPTGEYSTPSEMKITGSKPFQSRNE